MDRLTGLGPLAIFALLGVAAALGQAPFAIWYVGMAAFAAAFLFASRGAKQAGFGAGWSFGFGYFVTTLQWITEPFQVDAARHAWMALPALMLMAAGLALFWGAAFLLAARFGRRNALVLALALTLAEVLRANVFSGFPWAMPTYIWAGLAPAQLVAWIGPYGLGALTLLLAALPSVLNLWRGLALASLGVSLMFAIGQWRLNGEEAGFTSATLRIVQPNIAQKIKWDPARGEEFFQKHLRLSRGAPTDLVVWPESSVHWWFGADTAREAAISSAAQTYVAVGGRRFEGRRIYNTLALFDPIGEIDQRYDKRHLVPFGEYIPYGRFFERFGIYGLAAEEGAGFSAGSQAPLIDIPGVGKALPLICYEAIFPGLARHAPRADFILQVTNDAWFGNFAGPRQHFAQARFRAIEQGLPLVRSANTGISAMVDARGRIVAALAIGEEGALNVRLPKAIAPPLYSRTGDWPILVLLLISLAASLVVVRRR